jgi:hypothetical protein
MATNPPKRQVPKPDRSVIRWLLDSDPSIRWQTMRDLTDEPIEVVAAERAQVATKGWGARLLISQGPDGCWSAGTSNPNRLSLRRAAWARIPAQRGDRAGRACGRGDRPGRVQARRGWTLAPGERASQPVGRRAGRACRPAEPVDYAARFTSTGLVFSRRLTQMLLERDWQGLRTRQFSGITWTRVPM